MLKIKVRKIKLPARNESLQKFMEFVSSFAEAAGFSQNKIQEIDLAMEESLVNIFNYAYDNDQRGEVEVQCQMDGDTMLLIDIQDTGTPFDIRVVPDPDIRSGISERKIGGLGIMLIKNMVDEVKYRRENDCNILTLVVHRKN